MDGVPALALSGVDKHFGSVHANRSVDLSVAKGSIHGIVGENGAGKSTLMGIVYGYFRPDSGTIAVDGRTVDIASPQDSIRAGIGMVHQHFMLVETFTVLENILLGAEGGVLLARGEATARAGLAKLMADYSLEVDLDAKIADLDVGAQQRVEILKALYRGARHPDPRRADRRADAARGRRAICPARALARPGQDRAAHHAQAQGDPRDHRPRHGDAAGRRRRHAADRDDHAGGTRRTDGRPARAAARGQDRGEAGRRSAARG